MMKKFRMPLLAVIVAVYLLVFMSSPAVAGLIGSTPSSETAQLVRADEIDRIQKVLESQIVAEKLKAYGLSADEVNDKLKGMSDGQIHLLAQASDRVLAGGDGLGLVIGVLLVVILVIVLLKIFDKQVVVK